MKNDAKSYYPKEKEIKHDWYVVDLKDKTLGRAATKIVRVLQGKHKPTYTPAADCGDFVVAINADKIKLTGNKLTDKIYFRHTGFMGGIKTISAGKQLQKDSTELLKIAVKGMLAKGPLGNARFKKLKVYKGAEHPHAVQKPQELSL